MDRWIGAVCPDGASASPQTDASNPQRPPRGGLTPMTTASSVGGGGLEEGPDGEELAPMLGGMASGGLFRASRPATQGVRLDLPAPGAQYPGAGQRSGIPRWEFAPCGHSRGLFYAVPARVAVGGATFGLVTE